MNMAFTLDPSGLNRIFTAWSVPVPTENLVLFAFRGCLPQSKPKGWVASLDLASAHLDYRHLRCTLGIWNRKTGKVFATAGSTVPHRENVLKAAARAGTMQGRGTNQMEPGFYRDLQRGEHLQGKPMGHAALRQTGYRFYRRAHHAPPYTISDPLYFGNPYDNLHCAWNPRPEEPGFRSSGCLVVEGLPHCPRLADAGPNQGGWKVFHDLVYAGAQKAYPLLLLKGSEIESCLISTRIPSRFCYGSEGNSVMELQRALARKKLYPGSVDGKLGVATYRAWNRAGLKLGL